MKYFVALACFLSCIISGLTAIYGITQTDNVVLSIFFSLATYVLLGLFVELIKICRR